MKKFFVMFLVVSLIPALVGCSFWGGDDDDGTPVVGFDKLTYTAQAGVVKTGNTFIITDGKAHDLTFNYDFGDDALITALVDDNPATNISYCTTTKTLTVLNVNVSATPLKVFIQGSNGVVLNETIIVKGIDADAKKDVKFDEIATDSTVLPMTVTGKLYEVNTTSATDTRLVSFYNDGDNASMTIDLTKNKTAEAAQPLKLKADQNYGDDPIVKIEHKGVTIEDSGHKYVTVNGLDVTVNTGLIKEAGKYTVSVMKRDGSLFTEKTVTVEAL